MKRIAILQSNYIPWKGYFDIIRNVDEFIIYDEVQYTKHDWRNRNLIKTAAGLQWLTIPVLARGKLHQSICDAVVANHGWVKDHWRSLRQNYLKAPFFDHYAEAVELTYERALQETQLSRINRNFLELICGFLGITTPLTDSSKYPSEGNPTEKLVVICQLAEATHYLSGPSAKGYLEEIRFREAGIVLEYLEYSGYPKYGQMFGAFEHGVTVLDLIFNTGPDAIRYMKSLGARE